MTRITDSMQPKIQNWRHEIVKKYRINCKYCVSTTLPVEVNLDVQTERKKQRGQRTITSLSASFNPAG